MNNSSFFGFVFLRTKALLRLCLKHTVLLFNVSFISSFPHSTMLRTLIPSSVSDYGSMPLLSPFNMSPDCFTQSLVELLPSSTDHVKRRWGISLSGHKKGK